MANRTNFYQADISTYHWVKFNVENNRVCYILTGIFIVNLMGNSGNWLHERINMAIPIPELPEGQGIHIELWAPLFTLSSVFNAATAVNSGHAIDNFDLLTHGNRPQFR